jgi:RimJ/RimL family protein N-acetyltransferase
MLFFPMDIALISLTPEDFPKLISWAETEEFLLQWTGRTFTYPLTVKQLEKYYKGMMRSKPIRMIYKAIVENIHIGGITIDWEKSFKNEASITCVIVGDKDYIGKGTGELIVNKACKIAFEELGKIKLALNVFSFNHSAIRCYEKCGFSEIFRTKIEINGIEYINVRMERNK